MADLTGKLIPILVAVLVVFGLIPTITNYIKQSRTIYTVTGEWHNNTSVNDVVTVSNHPVVEDSETIKAYNATGAYLGTLVKGTNYTVDYWDGEFTITDLGSASSANLKFDYKWHYPSYLSSSGARAVVTLISLFVFLGIVYYIGSQFGVI